MYTTKTAVLGFQSADAVIESSVRRFRPQGDVDEDVLRITSRLPVQIVDRTRLSFDLFEFVFNSVSIRGEAVEIVETIFESLYRPLVLILFEPSFRGPTTGDNLMDENSLNDE